MLRTLLLSCEEFRLRAGAEPDGGGVGRSLHRWMCARCRHYEREVVALDLRVRAALGRPPPAIPAPRSVDHDGRVDS